jgi:Uma2 family endonuclease
MRDWGLDRLHLSLDAAMPTEVPATCALIRTYNGDEQDRTSRRSDVAIEAERRLITVDEFEHLIETGFFGPEERVELVNGEMITMPPIGDGHAGQVNRLIRVLGRQFASVGLLSVQNHIVLPVFGRPQPDVVVLRPRSDDYSRRGPRASDVLLLVEVSDSTLAYDRVTKGQMYAAAGIADYWIVDLVHRQLLVFREPTPEGYSTVQTLGDGDSIAPLAFPDATVAVSEPLIEA